MTRRTFRGRASFNRSRPGPGLSANPAPVTPAGTGSPAPPAPGATAGLSTGTATATAGGAVPLPIACTGASTCQGSVTLTTANGVAAVAARRPRKRIVRLGRARFVIPGGQTRTVRVRLSKRNQRLLRRLKRVRVSAKITLSAPAGPVSSSRVFTLRAPKGGRARRTVAAGA